jgi:PhzF family phenazine biosynthesis protein
MPSLAYAVVDAFTQRPFAGNPAAVCVLDAPLDDALLQRIAAELNLSETAFPLREGNGYRLRWFTPTTEVDLCGHATLATAHVLWESGRETAPTLDFTTRSGLLRATRGADGRIALDFPATRPVPVAAAAVPGLADALGASPVSVHRANDDLLVELASDAEVRRLAPDASRIAAFPARGVVVTARADEAGADFVSRFFCPAIGISEDPVTGATHCALGPFWAARLGKVSLRGYQASRRGGYVDVELREDRCVLRGHAVRVASGELAAAILR